jgi:hypothetical protein
MAARTVGFGLAMLLVLTGSSIVHGAQYQIRTSAGGKVVHTRLTPVIVHRVLPPFYGRHVYQGRAR